MVQSKLKSEVFKILKEARDMRRARGMGAGMGKQPRDIASMALAKKYNTTKAQATRMIKQIRQEKRAKKLMNLTTQGRSTIIYPINGRSLFDFDNNTYKPPNQLGWGISRAARMQKYITLTKKK